MGREPWGARPGQGQPRTKEGQDRGLCSSGIVNSVTLIHANSALGRSKLFNSPGGPVVKNLPADAGDTGFTPGPGRSYTLRGN